MKRKSYLLRELSRIKHFVESDVQQSRDKLRQQQDDPMLAVWNRCPCGKEYENQRVTCSVCGRQYD